MRDSGLQIHLAERLEPGLGVERRNVFLRVQQHGVGSDVVEGSRHELVRESLAAVIGAHNHPSDHVAGIPMFGHSVDKHPEVSDRVALGILEPVVGCVGLKVAVVEFFFVDALFDEEHIGAQFGDRVELCGGEFAPWLDVQGTIGHATQFNAVEGMFLRRRRSAMTYKIEKTDEQWRDELGDRYAILRKAGTERAWTGALLDEKRAGVYTCGACNAELFRSGAKFDSGSGWPSFFEAVNPDAVELKTDKSLFMTRTEVLCATCGSHLGHLFDDAYQTPTGDRYCMNSASLDFKET